MPKKMKRVLIAIICLVGMFFSVLATDTKVYAATKAAELKLNTAEASTYVGGKVTLKVKSVVPKDASKDVKWKSSNTKIATISSKGVVKGKKAGTVTITATSKSNKNVKAKCKVTVYKETKKIKLTSNKSYTLKVGETKTLKAKVTSPSKGAQPIQWSSENSKIAKVNSKGKVTAVKKGTTDIIAKSGAKQVKIKVTVKEGDAEYSGEQDGLKWTIDEKGKLTITGTCTKKFSKGDSFEGEWEKYKKNIKSAHLNFKAGKTLSWMFEGYSNLEKVTTGSKFNTSNVTDMEAMFHECKKLKEVDLSKFDTSKVTDMSNMFAVCENLEKIDLSKFNTSKVTDMGMMFYGCEGIKKLDLSRFNTAKVKNMSGMFWNCSGLKELNISKFNTGKVTDMSNIFSGTAMEKLDLSGFNTKSVTNMDSMFASCWNLCEINLSGFNTSNVENMCGMFSQCNSLRKLDLSNFNTGKVETMLDMFYQCNSLSELDLSSFDTSNVKYMGYMFAECENLTKLDVSSFDTVNVKSMGYMFLNCSNIAELDVSSFHTGKVTSMKEMFKNCYNLTSIFVGENWKVIPECNCNNMFLNCGVSEVTKK